jgi:hypothetical protein
MPENKKLQLELTPEQLQSLYHAARYCVEENRYLIFTFATADTLYELEQVLENLTELLKANNLWDNKIYESDTWQTVM